MKINTNTKEFDCIAIFAVRYALGRSSAAVVIATDFIANNKASISKSALKNIISEIQEHDYNNNLGMECDKTLWLELKNELMNYTWCTNDK